MDRAHELTVGSRSAGKTVGGGKKESPNRVRKTKKSGANLVGPKGHQHGKLTNKKQKLHGVPKTTSRVFPEEIKKSTS